MLKRNPLGIHIHETVGLNSTERHIRPGSCLYEPHTPISFFPNGWQICQDRLPMARPSHSNRGHDDVPPTRPSGTKAPTALASSENGHGWRLTKHPSPGIALSQSELTHPRWRPLPEADHFHMRLQRPGPSTSIENTSEGPSRLQSSLQNELKGLQFNSSLCLVLLLSLSPRCHSQELNGTNTVSLQISFSESASRSLT